MGTDDISTAAPADVTAGGDQDQTNIIIKVQNADELRLAQMGMLCCSSYIYIYFYLRRKEGRKGIRKRQRPGLIALVDRSQAGVEAPFHHLQSDRAGIDVYDLVDG